MVWLGIDGFGTSASTFGSKTVVPQPIRGASPCKRRLGVPKPIKCSQTSGRLVPYGILRAARRLTTQAASAPTLAPTVSVSQSAGSHRRPGTKDWWNSSVTP